MTAFIPRLLYRTYTSIAHRQKNVERSSLKPEIHVTASMCRGSAAKTRPAANDAVNIFLESVPGPARLNNTQASMKTRIEFAA